MRQTTLPQRHSSQCAGERTVDKALQTVEIERPPVTGMELTGSELEEQMEEIQREMEKRTQRAEKYKRLYVEEKRRCEEVTAQLQMLLKVLVTICFLLITALLYLGPY